MGILHALFAAFAICLWCDLSRGDAPAVAGDLFFLCGLCIIQLALCIIEESEQEAKRRLAQLITPEEYDDGLSKLFWMAAAVQARDREAKAALRAYQVSCDGPFTEEGEPTGGCTAKSPACDSGPESNQLARDLGWMVSEDGQGWDACPVHRDYDTSHDEETP